MRDNMRNKDYIIQNKTVSTSLLNLVDTAEDFVKNDTQ